MKTWMTTLLALMICTGVLRAQDEPEENTPAWHLFLNGNLQLGIPVEAFRQNLDRNGFGGGGIFLLQLKTLPVFAGLELSGITYDSESIRYTVNVGGFLTDYKLSTRNNIFLGHVVFRVQPEIRFPIRPYFDGMIGFKHLYTRTVLEEEDTDTTNGDTDQKDWAFSYGGAAGIQLSLFRNKSVTIDLRCAYLPGANANYLVRRENANGPFDDPLDAFEETSSPTTLLLPQIGVTFNLSTVDREDYYDR